MRYQRSRLPLEQPPPRLRYLNAIWIGDRHMAASMSGAHQLVIHSKARRGASNARIRNRLRAAHEPHGRRVRTTAVFPAPPLRTGFGCQMAHVLLYARGAHTPPVVRSLRPNDRQSGKLRSRPQLPSHELARDQRMRPTKGMSTPSANETEATRGRQNRQAAPHLAVGTHAQRDSSVDPKWSGGAACSRALDTQSGACAGSVWSLLAC